MIRAFAICTKSAIEEHNNLKNRKLNKPIGYKENVEFTKWVICLEKNLKNKNKKDGILEKLHLEQLTKLINEAKNNDFNEMMKQKSKSLINLQLFWIKIKI